MSSIVDDYPLHLATYFKVIVGDHMEHALITIHLTKLSTLLLINQLSN